MLRCQPMTTGLKMWPRNAAPRWNEEEQVIALWNIMLIVVEEDLSGGHEEGQARSSKQSRKEWHLLNDVFSSAPRFLTIWMTPSLWIVQLETTSSELFWQFLLWWIELRDHRESTLWHKICRFTRINGHAYFPQARILVYRLFINNRNITTE